MLLPLRSSSLLLCSRQKQQNARKTRRCIGIASHHQIADEAYSESFFFFVLSWFLPESCIVVQRNVARRHRRAKQIFVGVAHHSDVIDGQKRRMIVSEHRMNSQQSHARKISKCSIIVALALNFFVFFFCFFCLSAQTNQVRNKLTFSESLRLVRCQILCNLALRKQERETNETILSSFFSSYSIDNLL